MIPALEVLILLLRDESMNMKKQLIQGTRQITNKRLCVYQMAIIKYEISRCLVESFGLRLVGQNHRGVIAAGFQKMDSI